MYLATAPFLLNIYQLDSAIRKELLVRLGKVMNKTVKNVFATKQTQGNNI